MVDSVSGGDALFIATCNRIAGLSQEELADGLSYSIALLRLQARLLNRPGPIVAWNIHFDRAMLRRTLMGVNEDDLFHAHVRKRYDGPELLPMMCGLPWGRCLAHYYNAIKGPINGHYKGPEGQPLPRMVRLDQALRREGVTREGRAHRALSDAEATAKLVIKMWRGEIETWTPAVYPWPRP